MVLTGSTEWRRQRGDMHTGEPRCGGFPGIRDGSSLVHLSVCSVIHKACENSQRVSVELVAVIEHYFAAH